MISEFPKVYALSKVLFIKYSRLAVDLSVIVRYDALIIGFLGKLVPSTYKSPDD